MKAIRLFVMMLGVVYASSAVQAQECELPISVSLIEQATSIPVAAENVLKNSLTRMVVKNGMNSDLGYTQFLLTARVDVLDKSVLPGPPMKISQNLGVTFYVVDIYNQKKFSTAYVEVNGVGNNDNKSLIHAFRQLNPQNVLIEKMLKEGKQKILNYYNTQYPNILKEAKRLANVQQYEKAIALVSSIPVCTNGGDEALEVGLQIFERYRDRYSQILLNKAKVIWASGQSADAALEAGEYLLQVDPDAACYKEALQLATEIKEQVRADIDFEMREKHRDAVKVEEQRIAAIKAIGVAYGNGQKEQTTNLMWLK